MADSPGRLADQSIAILGLGLMGGSLAYALSNKCATLSGVDPDPATRLQAQTSGIFAQVCSQPDQITRPVDVWILAAPVRAILKILADMPGWKGLKGIVLDIGSTKTQIIAAMQSLPDRYDPLGGHPMCGKETGSFANADGNLFRGAPFAFCSLERTTPGAISIANELSETLGAYSLWLSPEVHDRWVAATSHLPYLVANALAAATPLEAAPLIGPGFRSTTRVSGSPPEMMLDILLTNREAILAAARRFQEGFSSLLSLLENPPGAENAELFQQLSSGRQRRMELLELEEKT